MLRQASALAPKDNATRINLGMALSAKGQLDEAISVLRKAVDFGPHPPWQRPDYQRWGNVDEAIVPFRKAVALDARASWPSGDARPARASSTRRCC